ncbi:MFS multidrug transporter protein [Rutstroemia sp. NJR-2017a BBW]|nr:MFS multidrug transporter protein [Rutstroemia sp. NJR-2017a BBW]
MITYASPIFRSKTFSIMAVFKKETSFYPVLICLCICIFIATLDTVIVAASLPAIAKSLNATSSEAYWCRSGFLFAQTVAQPIYGGFAETLGHKRCLLLALGIFTVASLLCATAQNITWLIATRVVRDYFQSYVFHVLITGLGSAGVNVLVNVIMADLVPLDRRAKYMGIVQLSGAVGLCSGVIIGAAASQAASWRWIFYINLPICIPTMVAIWIFLRQPLGSIDIIEKLKHFDFTGMTLLTGSLISILYGLTAGGILYAWSSARIIASLAIGAVGIGGTMLYEGLVAKNPMIPPRIFTDRTASLGYVTTWCQALVLWAYAYFITLYSLSAIAVVPVAAAIGGIGMSMMKKFKWINVFASALLTTGFILMSRLNVHSSQANQIGFQILSAIGGGILFPGRLCAVQAPQAAIDVSIATALVSFFTSLGESFGVAIGDATFQNRWQIQLKRNLKAGLIPEKYVVGSKAAEQIGGVISSFPSEVQDIYRDIMADAISTLWIVVGAFGALAFIACLLSKDLRLDMVNEPLGSGEESEEVHEKK